MAAACSAMRAWLAVALLCCAARAQPMCCGGDTMVCIVDRDTAYIQHNASTDAARTLASSSIENTPQGVVVQLFDDDAVVCEPQLLLPVFIAENRCCRCASAVLFVFVFCLSVCARCCCC